MKKLIVTTLATAVVAMGAYAQGTISFKNINGSPAINAPVFLSDGTTKLGGTYTAGIMAGTTAANMAIVPGVSALFNSGLFAGGAVSLPGIPGGSTAFLQVVAFATSSGSYAAAQAANIQDTWGHSGTFSVVTGDNSASPPTTPAFLVRLTSFNLNTAVPEPSSLALASLCAAALMIFRRRK